MFKITFATNTQAFKRDPAEECIFLINRVANALRAGEVTGVIGDSDGLPVGEWELIADRD